MTATTSTIRIAAIDRYAGYLWGDTMGTARDLCVAAVAIQKQSDNTVDWRAEETGRDAAEASLDLYEVPADLVLGDGQDQAMIEAVEAGEYLGTVRVWDRAEDR